MPKSRLLYPEEFRQRMVELVQTGCNLEELAKGEVTEHLLLELRGFVETGTVERLPGEDGPGDSCELVRHRQDGDVAVDAYFEAA